MIVKGRCTIGKMSTWRKMNVVDEILLERFDSRKNVEGRWVGDG